MNNAEAAILIFFTSVMAPSSSPTPPPVRLVSADHAALKHHVEKVKVTSIMGEPDFHVEIGESFLVTNNN